MRVLIACETSGVVRRAFAARGYDAWSCDLLPADDATNRHIQCDIRDILNDGWDLLAVIHPPCTRLCNSGVRWLSVPPPSRTLESMWQELEEGCALFSACLNAPIKCKVLENPVMHRHARERIPGLMKPQIVQPWWFGDPAFKATGLYRKNLPDLVATNKLVPPRPGTPEHKLWSAVHRASPGPLRWKDRSKAFEGMAAAFAQQFGSHAEQFARAA